VITGYLFRRRFPLLAERHAPDFSALGGLAILLIVGVVLASNHTVLLGVSGSLFVGLLALNLIGYLGGVLAAKLYRWEAPAVRTLTLEIGLQNAGLGSVLSLKFFGDRVALPSTFYTALCLVTAFLWISIWQHWQQRSS